MMVQQIFFLKGNSGVNEVCGWSLKQSIREQNSSYISFGLLYHLFLVLSWQKQAATHIRETTKENVENLRNGA